MLTRPNLLARITLSYPEKVQRKTPFLNWEITARVANFLALCVAAEVHLKETPHQKHGNTRMESERR